MVISIVGPLLEYSSTVLEYLLESNSRYLSTPALEYSSTSTQVLLSILQLYDLLPVGFYNIDRVLLPVIIVFISY